MNPLRIPGSTTLTMKNGIKKQFDISTMGKIAAHVPDLVVFGDFSQDVPFIESFDGVLLFVDISGFTALTEKYSMNTNLDHGADQLTQTLNHYVGDIVEEVLVFGGDVLKFAGDALLALWRVERCHIHDIITLALKCSFSIQHEFGVRDTEVGLELRVKIGVSAGHISKVVVGDNRHHYFLVIGRAVDEVRLAQSLAKASEIILSPNCWELCDRDVIEVERIQDQRAVKARYIKNAYDYNNEDFLNRCMKYLNQSRTYASTDLLRSASVLPPDEELEKRLRKYVMRNILRKIDDNQPLEYLSELRPVTVVFVNLQFDESANTLHLCKAIQDANTRITGLIHPLSGKINKVFMFDKGCTVLCIFGLPGDKQPDESTHALDSAFKIHHFCSTALMKLKIVSIGVTSGPVFCGVVGHRLRHEYTVIGQKVNLAARMMMYYPGVVTCDSITYLTCKLPQHFFEELPYIEMKGVLNPGKVYQFLGVSEKTMIYKAYLNRERNEIYPLLGRQKETDIFENSLKQFKDSGKGRTQIVVYQGQMGYGKSQLMAEIAFLAQAPGQRVVAIELTKINMWQNFFAVRTLMAMFLGIDTCKTYDARQFILVNKLRGIIQDEYLCLFNTLFHVKISEKEALIFIIDEAQFIDSVSWEFLDNLIMNFSILIVMSLSPLVRKGRQLSSAAARVMKNSTTTYIHLRELTPSVIVRKACQDLGVVSIARELETFLIQRSHGNPFYCEELLRNLHLNNVLQFHVVEEEEETEDEWDNLFRTALKVQTQPSNDHHDQVEEESYICTVRQNVKLHNIMLPPTLKGIALAELDNMNPSEQMVVKCAAIIGVTFETELLLHILPEWTKMKMNQTLAALVESNIFKCFGERKDILELDLEEMNSNELCLNVVKPSWERLGPEYEHGSELGSFIAKRLKQEENVMQCRVMRFCTPLLQEAAYELWLKSQKIALHLKCASYLEWHAHKCKCCGKGDFIPFHRYAVEGMLFNIDPEEQKAPFIKDSLLNDAAAIIVSETLIKLRNPSQDSVFDPKDIRALMDPLVSTPVGFLKKPRACLQHPWPEEVTFTSLSGAPGLHLMATIQSNYGTFYTDVVTVPSMGNLWETHRAIQIRKSLGFVFQSNKLPVPDKLMSISSESCLSPSARSSALSANKGTEQGQQKRASQQETARVDRKSLTEDAEKEFLTRMDEIILLTQMSKEKVKQICSCECEDVVDSVIVPLSNHCLTVGNMTRSFYYLLECAAAYIQLSNNYMAFTYLNTAENLLKSIDQRQKPINQFEESILCSLKGEVSFNMGQIILAKRLIKRALKLLRKSFPMTLVGAFFTTMVETSKLMSRQKKQYFWQTSNGREKRLSVLYQQSHCLSILWQIFSLDLATSSKKFSRLAALMKLNCAEESQDEFQIITSYMEFSLCCQVIGFQHDWMKYEYLALKRSCRLHIVGGGLLTIVKLALLLAYMKLCLGSFSLAIRLGFRAHEMCVLLKKPKLDYGCLSDLFSALFFSTRFRESVQVLSWLEDHSIRDVVAKAYFVSGCLDLMLYAGFSFKPFQFCLDFVNASETNFILMSQNSITLGLYTSLAVWFARLQLWDEFKEPFEQARRLVRRTNTSLSANNGFCKFLECKALLLRKYIEENPELADETLTRMAKNLDQAVMRCAASPIFYPRVYLMKAYVHLLLGQDDYSQIFLDKAFQSCDVYGNRLERSWLEITQEWWFTGTEPMEDCWLKAAPDFPVWKVGVELEKKAYQKNKYLMKVPEVDLFSESSKESLC